MKKKLGANASFAAANGIAKRNGVNDGDFSRQHGEADRAACEG
jgi:hypothetical protein